MTESAPLRYTKLSIIVPAYNEAGTIEASLRRALDAELEIDREVLVINDGSTDATAEIVAGMDDPRLRLIEQPENMGKGAALRRGFAEASGDLVVVHDADLEYDPRDWRRMLEPLQEGAADVVYGSRFTGERRNMMFWHWMGNRFLSLVTNVLYNTTISDMETCYKMIDTNLIRSVRLEANRFDIEPEITSKLLRSGCRIYEVPIRYTGREIHEGKKISWRDGIPALLTLLKFRVMPMRSIRA
jgi:glycosyltransferase involved in cell wall biosynthesis